MKRLIIDADTGIDDAEAILLALHAHKLGKVKIEAITLVQGNTEVHHAVRNTYRLLETVGMAEVLFKLSLNDSCERSISIGMQPYISLFKYIIEKRQES